MIPIKHNAMVSPPEGDVPSPDHGGSFYGRDRHWLDRERVGFSRRQRNGHGGVPS